MKDRYGEVILSKNRFSPLLLILRKFSAVVNKLSDCYHVRISV